MSVPDTLKPYLDGEQVAARVSLGGEDTLFVTATRTLVYRAEGLLSDESVEEYPHDAERIAVTEGRRKAKISLDYGIDGTREIAVPAKRVDEALHPVLAGVLNAAGVTDPGETITETYRFSELTLVITSARLVKHIGAAVWDTEFEEYHYDDITSLEVEEGSVSSQIVLDVAGRPQRIKAQNDVSREIHERLKRALLAHHDVGSYAEFRATVAADDEADDAPARESAPSVEFDESIEPLEANLPDDEPEDPLAASGTAEPSRSVGAEPAGGVSAEQQVREGAVESEAPEPEPNEEPAGGFADSGFESASSSLSEPAADIEALTRAVERQNEVLERQQRTIERLVEELSRGR